MKRISLFWAAIMTCLLLITGCQSTTTSGIINTSRNQFLLVSSEETNSAAAAAYKKIVDQADAADLLNTDEDDIKRVRTISKKLIAQTNIFRSDAQNWAWEINVISSSEVNAYCMPGGKIAVYSGLIQSLNLTDDELAAVIGHEISHALREHSREQISQQFATEQALSIAGSLIGLGSIEQIVADQVSNLILTLPFSRTMETEADIMGLELMARAGYNPEAAISIWEKMEKQEKHATPELLSTHPSDASRMKRLRAELPKVTPLYQATIKAHHQQNLPKKKKKK